MIVKAPQQNGVECSSSLFNFENSKVGSSHVYLTDPFHEKGTNVKQFLVRWKGCASKDDTWES